jgi:hypothetical protein
VGHGQGLLLVGGPGQVDLEEQRLVLAAVGPEGVDHRPEGVVGLVDGDQAVGPAAHPGGGVGADRRPDQHGRPRREGPQLGPVDPDQAVVADRLAGQQGPDDGRGLA